MSILDALKNLVVKRGGTPKGSNIAEVIDDLAETSSGGGGSNVVIVDLSELSVEHDVDFIDPFTGELATFENIYLFDVDPNKYYIFKTVMGDPPIVYDAYGPQAKSVTFSATACEDTSEESWIERKTFSDTVDIIQIVVLPVDDDALTFVPTSTQFKTYKQYFGGQ